MGLASIIEIKPHPQLPGSRRQLGAEVFGIDLNSLSGWFTLSPPPNPPPADET